MDKKSKEQLRYIQNNPTTGAAHNKQIIYAQIEEVFAIDGLRKDIKKLTRTVISLDEKNTDLENSNLQLQRQMLYLTTIATVIVVFQFLQNINLTFVAHFVSNMLSQVGIFIGTIELATYIAVITAILSGILSFYFQRKYVTNRKKNLELFTKMLKSQEKRSKRNIDLLTEVMKTKSS